MAHSDSSPDCGAPTLDELCGNAIKLQLAGQIQKAELLYREILQIQPRHATANHCFGMMNVQLRRPLDALPYLLAALEVNPEISDYWLGYLEALLLAGRIEDAESALTLGRQHGLAGGAVEEFARRLTSRCSQSAASVGLLPAKEPPARPNVTRPARRRQQRLIQERESALLATLSQGRLADALVLARSLAEAFPERGFGWKTQGALLFAEGRRDEAVAAMQMAVQVAPRDAEAHKNFGTILNKLERLDEAEASFRRALDIDPTLAAAHFHLGDTYQLQGQYSLAEASFRSAISCSSHELQEDQDLNYSGLLFVLSHKPDVDPDALFAEHCRVGEKLGAGLAASWPRHRNIPDPNRRLRVGFVSGDLCNHPVANFIAPVLASLQNHSGVEVHAYNTNPVEDSVSESLRAHFDQRWHPVSNLSAIQLAKRIIDDRIDILVDLSGHTAMNRLRTFARKPAPIQISWVGYPGTTGLLAMDYYLAGRHFLPPGEFDRYFTEKLIQLPLNVPFEPYATAPAVNRLPALESGHVTFGSFNRLGKITDYTIALWSRLLRELPASRMLVGGVPPATEKSLLERFFAQGIAAERLTFHKRTGMDAYLSLHHQVDLCLDTTPYAGGTTICHALWMGVPTLTVAGPTPPSRSGAAFLGDVDLFGFIAIDAADFAAKGVHWATHLAELAEVRAGLRRRCEQLGFRQPELIAAAFVHAMRRVWSQWCRELAPESFEISASELPTWKNDA